VGWGEFNFAWSLTPFPGRPVAFFDHTHNLPLQLAVELGIPCALLVLGLVAWALAQVLRNGLSGPEDHRSTARCALVMVSMMAVHSMLEYPLWYAYFLLPTCFAFGVALGRPTATATGDSGLQKEATIHAQWPARAMIVAGCTIALGGVFSLADYIPVVRIFAPTANDAPLPDRIHAGQRSWFSAHHADYAAATTAALSPSETMKAFGRSSHYLLDTRLMMAWARAYAERGDLDRARYLADRLREFHNPLSEEFFAECAEPPANSSVTPFQCEHPSRTLSYEDFLHPE
jgi:hypothetical protein